MGLSGSFTETNINGINDTHMINRCITPNCSSKRRKGCKRCHKCITKKYRLENPLMSFYHKIKWSAKKRNVEFKLTHKEFEDFCMRTGYITKKLAGLDVTMDRIREGEAYQADNIQLLFRGPNIQKYMAHKKEQQQISIEQYSEIIGSDLFYSGNPL